MELERTYDEEDSEVTGIGRVCDELGLLSSAKACVRLRVGNLACKKVSKREQALVIGQIWCRSARQKSI